MILLNGSNQSSNPQLSNQGVWRIINSRIVVVHNRSFRRLKEMALIEMNQENHANQAKRPASVQVKKLFLIGIS